MPHNHRRFVAHFDMLGMKNAIVRNTDEAWRALCGINEARKRFYQLKIEIPNKRLVIENQVRTFFCSDTVIIFTLSDKLEDLYAIIVLSAELFKHSLHKCVPLRGGIAHGEFFFNLEESIFLGEPLVRAYNIGECAQWMGIVLDQYVAESARQLFSTKEIVKWEVPQKNKEPINEYVLNWPWVYRNNFTQLPVSLEAFYQPFHSLFGSFEELPDLVKVKYINTVLFINSMF